jgi:hypothetical protein
MQPIPNKLPSIVYQFLDEIYTTDNQGERNGTFATYKTVKYATTKFSLLIIHIGAKLRSDSFQTISTNRLLYTNMADILT